jgi:hypothetical protein
VNTFSPSRAVDAALNLTSNDTDPGTDVLHTVGLSGFARAEAQDQVLKIEMEYENADNAWAGSDFRDVNLILDSADGVVTCKKPRLLDGNNNGTFGETGEVDDFCAQWTSTGGYGEASWLALGSFEEPERIVVRGLGPTGGNGEEFEVRVAYVEDCANIPSSVLADILAVGGSPSGVGPTVDPATISATIAENCFEHASSLATVRLSLDGVVVATTTTSLAAKGDAAVVARLRRVDGAFCSLTPGFGDASLQCP